MNKLTIHIGTCIFFVALFGCSDDSKSKELFEEIEQLEKENDSLRNILESDQMVQTVSHDTALYGTTFLPYSSKMIGLMNRGLEPIDFTIIKDCQASMFRNEDYPKFINIVRTETTLTIDVEIIGNFCHNFLGEAEVVGENTLNLIYTDYGGFCSWGPCTLRYIFNTTMEKEYQTLKYVTINGSKVVGLIPNEE
jgi:hypothetical protein